MLGNPNLKVYSGEIQCKALGMDVAIFNEKGEEINQKKGELVCKTTFPSKPLYFWNDYMNKKYLSAYFNKYANIWHHGDCAMITKNNGFIMPIFEYPNNANYAKTLFGIKQPDMDGCSITGGYIYRGSEISELYGRYIFGDYCTGKVWSMQINNGKSSDLQNHTDDILLGIGKKEFYLSSFGQDQNGEIYIIDYNGTIYRLINI